MQHMERIDHGWGLVDVIQQPAPADGGHDSSMTIAEQHRSRRFAAPSARKWYHYKRKSTSVPTLAVCCVLSVSMLSVSIWLSREGKGAVDPKKRILHVVSNRDPSEKENHRQVPFSRPCLPVTVPSASQCSLTAREAVDGPHSTKYGAAVGLRFGISMRPMPIDH